jgi:hypothetical protein
MPLLPLTRPGVGKLIVGVGSRRRGGSGSHSVYLEAFRFVYGCSGGTLSPTKLSRVVDAWCDVKKHFKIWMMSLADACGGSLDQSEIDRV